MEVSFSYEDIGESLVGHIYRPVAKVNLTSPHVDIDIDTWMIVDTGADFTILPNHLSKKLRISLESECKKEITYGVGGSQAIYFYKSKLKARIGEIEREIPIAFFDNDEVPALLGRMGFLETLNTEFLKSRKTVFKD